MQDLTPSFCLTPSFWLMDVDAVPRLWQDADMTFFLQLRWFRSSIIYEETLQHGFTE